MTTTTDSSPLRAAIYARYSTDRQRETSIDDQVRVAAARAAAAGWTVVARHTDQGISGSVPVALRPGGKALLADVLAGRIDVLVLEGLDRLSRELGEAELVTKRLEHRGIRIVGVADGYDSAAQGRKVMRIARGLVNELYLDDLRHKTHRGLAGQFERGFSAGGRCYGYTTREAAGGRELVVDVDQAAVVVRIYEAYAAGDSARTIVHRLNAEGVASPRGGLWAVSALVGDRRRGAGVLNNELYVGRVIWNRRQWLKDPDTGRRTYVDRPRDEWQMRDAPELRIVPAALWDAARARDLRRNARPQGGAPLRTLFAGLLRCPACAGPIIAIDSRRYGCHARRDRGPAACSSAMAWPRRAGDGALLAMVRDELLAPAALADLHDAVRTALANARRTTGVDADAARLAALQGEIARLADAVAQLGLSDALRARLTAAEAERAALEQRVARRASSPVPTAAEVMAGYKRRLLQLQAALESDSDRDRTRALLAEMLGPVTLTRDEEGDWAEMEKPAARVALAGSTPPTMVAGACNSGRRRVRVR